MKQFDTPKGKATRLESALDAFEDELENDKLEGDEDDLMDAYKIMRRWTWTMNLGMNMMECQMIKLSHWRRV